jgi:hypothetical protein
MLTEGTELPREIPVLGPHLSSYVAKVKNE